MDVRKVKKLIELLEESRIVGEIEIREGEELVRISRAPHSAAAEIRKPAETPAQTATTEIASHGAAATAGSAAGKPPAETDGAEADSETTALVKSPMVGTFYRAPNPTVGPFVKEGDRVESGQTLCIIEAMKTMNEIEAEQAGVIKKILAENGDPVEYGQELFILETA